MASGHLRLNTFQLLMRQWRELAPYNAGTLLRIAGPADPDRWQRSIEMMIGELQLGKPIFEEPDFVKFELLKQTPIKLVQNLEAEVTAQANQPFADDEMPMRFFIAPADEESHWLGFMFDHWLTDGGTIAELVVRLVIRYAEPDAHIGYRPHQFNSRPFAELFPGKFPCLEGAAPVREAARVRTEHREIAPFSPCSVRSFTSGFQHTKWPAGLFEKMQSQARMWDASVHDLLLAVVAQELIAGQEEISLASVMDLRGEVFPSAAGIFAQFVGFYTNVIDQASCSSLPELTRQLALTNRRNKDEGRPLQNFGALEAARQGWEKAATLEEKAMQFHRLAPIAAGISHMKVTRLHREIGRAIVRHRKEKGGYFEASPLLDATVVSPTGPLTPLLLTLNKLSPLSVMMGVTYRLGCHTDDQIKTWISKLMDRFLTL